MDLPLPERIASTRPLAMRVEVVEPGADPVRAEALPFETVQLTPFMVDPDGPLTLDEIESELAPVWLACPLQPVEGLFSCLSNQLPLEADAIEDCPDVDPSAFDPTATELPTLPSPCWIRSDAAAQPQFRVPIDVNFLLGGDLEVTMVGHVPGAGDTPGCLDQLLSEAGEISADCMYITQRVSIGPDARLLELATDFGVPGVDQFGVVPEEIPDPDTHPRIMSLTVRVVDENEDEVSVATVQRGQVIDAVAGHRLDLETVAPEEDLQTYLIPRDMTDFDERTETYSGRWFVSWGTLLSPVSDDPLSQNEWSMIRGAQDEEDLPAGGRATLFYVLRDDRQGVDWTWFHVDVTEAP